MTISDSQAVIFEESTIVQGIRFQSLSSFKFSETTYSHMSQVLELTTEDDGWSLVKVGNDVGYVPTEALSKDCVVSNGMTFHS